MRKKLFFVLIAGMMLGLVTPASATGEREAEWPLDSQHLRAEQAWTTTRGHGITIAVLDSGCQADHPDLAGQVLAGTGFVGVAGDTGRSDRSRDSHGTSIAAIIAGSGKNDSGTGMIGLAPEARILPVRVTIDSETQPVSLAEGIIYAVDNGARIITISESTAVPDPNLRSAVGHALDRGVLIVAATGNNGQSGNPPSYPAYFPGVVAVTGVDPGNEFWPESQSGPQVTLAAPATDILTANNHGGYLRGDGTSYAAPFVAAAAALVWSKWPDLSAGQVIRQLTDTADRHSDATHDDRYGFGIVNPLKALTSSLTTASGIPAIAPVASSPEWQWPAIVIIVVFVAVIGGWFLRRKVFTRKGKP
ncbi:type VII secretion-associated serine protease mycosin [Amycolatopsis sp., V23-08]|uniref:Type VII secretion-associated serine protease mycosin n=1 Tax=Amycolatopsis heterodermiae TaxID=3110235 RepID=A0ABU5RLZ8_9PSEU|nr:type VII secretion-associated serine protease mycosin [Amycolatopsis sp., V23-08]MEA5367218.1 type VII secretion-associated serine protease mycosin [Amycolatopsis sp., V23-08]